MSSSFISLTDRILVAPQIQAEDVAKANAEGVSLIINNRPDGEAPGQPSAAELEAASAAAGVSYAFIPVGRDGIGPAHLEAAQLAIAQATGKTLMFCRTGTRSTHLWGRAAAAAGWLAPDEIIACAAEGGYDLSPARGELETLAARKSEK